MNTKIIEIKPKSIKYNYVLNNIRLLINIAFPLLVFPYVSRILGPEGLGNVEYANSIIAYFILFTSIGIPSYGSRIIARNRDSIESRSKIVLELTIIQLSTVFIGYVIYSILIIFNTGFHSSILLFIVVAPSVFFTDFSFEWFFIGIEDQKYITIRYIIVKIFQLVCIYLFVKRMNDFIYYAVIAVGCNSISTIFNIRRLKKYIDFRKVNTINILKHIKPTFAYFSASLAISIYVNMDIIMVGTIVGKTEVGLYSIANKLVRILLLFITSLPAMMIPRMENSLQKENKIEYKSLVNKSVRYILLLALPAIFGINLLAEDIIHIFAGSQFTDSILSVRLLSPILLIVGFAYLVGLQILNTNRMEKYYTLSVSIAAIVNFIVNIILIPIYKQNGAIVGTVIAEAVGLCIEIFFARKLLRVISINFYEIAKYLIACVVFSSIIFLEKIFISDKISLFIIALFTSLIVYFSLLVFMKESITIGMLNQAKARIRNNG